MSQHCRERMYKVTFSGYILYSNYTVHLTESGEHLKVIITSERLRNHFYHNSHWFCSVQDGECKREACVGGVRRASVVVQWHWGIFESWKSSVHDSPRLFSAQMQNAWLTIIGSGKIDGKQARGNVCTSVCSLRLGRVRKHGTGDAGRLLGGRAVSLLVIPASQINGKVREEGWSDRHCHTNALPQQIWCVS